MRGSAFSRKLLYLASAATPTTTISAGLPEYVSRTCLLMGLVLGKKRAREGLVDDGGANADGGILRFNFPPHQDGNPERGKVSWADMIHA